MPPAVDATSTAAESLSTAPKVSFVIPTLNRGRYVVRAVTSCLRAAEVAEVDVEVVVLDSESNDGSWELLNVRFGADDRVRLVQNKRGLGPTRSWLDGARLISGEYVTFIWSDDYVGEGFLKALIPHFGPGVPLVVGRGLVRDLDDESPFPEGEGSANLSPEAFLLSYFGGRGEPGWVPPNSPACALFSRGAFDAWVALAEEVSSATVLRHAVNWRRAIGPDLLLFFVAVQNEALVVPVVKRDVVQFSAHPGSISIETPDWFLDLGYWLVRAWMLSSSHICTLTPAARRMVAKYCLTHAITFLLFYRVQIGERLGHEAQEAFGREVVNLWGGLRTNFSSMERIAIVAMTIYGLLHRPVRQKILWMRAILRKLLLTVGVKRVPFK